VGKTRKPLAWHVTGNYHTQTNKSSTFYLLTGLTFIPNY